MKTHVFKRLSALMAGFAVALVGSLSALPQAHAATNYTLDQVGGKADIFSVSVNNQPVGGLMPNGSHVSGLTMPKYGFGWSAPVKMDVTFDFTKLSLAQGDRVTIPFNFPAATQSPVIYTNFACGGNPVDGVSVTCSNSSMVLSATKKVEYSSLHIDVPVTFVTAKSTQATEYVYVQNQFIGIAQKLFWIDTEPGASLDDTCDPAQDKENFLVTGTVQQGNVFQLNVSDRYVYALNGLLKGAYNQKSPDISSNRVAAFHVDVPYGASVSSILFGKHFPTLSNCSGQTEYFGGNLRWWKAVNIDTVMTKVSLTRAQLAHPETALQPGQYAVVDNGGGSFDFVFNFGSLYNNSLLATPTNQLPDVGTASITAEEREKYAWLADRGYANRVPFVSVKLTVDNEKISRRVPIDWQKYKVNGTQVTATSYSGNYLYDGSLFASGAGEVPQAALGYNKNGSDVTGTGPAATAGAVGTKVNVANQGGWKRTGYAFTGWNTKADGKGTAYQPGASVTLPREGITLYAQWTAVKDVVPGTDPQPDNYVKVTFAKGANGKSLSGRSSYWVNPTKTVTLTAPTAVPNTGWKFSKWDKVYTNTKFTGNTTITAQYTAVADVVPGSDPQPDGYVKVSFAKGAHGTLSGQTSYWVNPTKSVTLKAPTVKPNTGYVFSEWDKAFAGVKFTGNTTITAQYTAVGDVVPGTDPQPAGYVKVSFAPGAHGTLSGTTSYWVNPAKTVTVKAPKVTAVSGWKFAKWDKALTGKFTKATTITAQYAKVSVKPTPTSSPTKPAPSDQCAASDPAKQEKVYRLYNPGNSEHLFTTDAVEYEVLADKHGWKQEGVAWVGPNSRGSSVGVYRLYNAGLGDHHYTKDQAEAKKLVSEFGWVYDNNGQPLFYSEDNDKCARIDVYRQYNGGLKTGQHHYTADKTEWDTLAAKHGWQKEGIGWYALSWPNPKG